MPSLRRASLVMPRRFAVLRSYTLAKPAKSAHRSYITSVRIDLGDSSGNQGFFSGILFFNLTLLNCVDED
jgi:hypothetical protein